MVDMKAIRYSAKDRLMSDIENVIDKLEMDGRVSSQLNAMAARDSLVEIKALNRVSAYKLEKRILSAEDDKMDNKYGFPYVPVSPIDYPAFIEDIK